MKRCSYCGKEHPDDATVCDRDGEPLVDPAKPLPPKPPTPPAIETMNWFDKMYAKTSMFGILLCIFCACTFPFGLIGIIACKNPAARKNAWIILIGQILLWGFVLWIQFKLPPGRRYWDSK